MKSNEKRYRFIRPWQSRQPGDERVFEIDYGDMLVRQGIAQPVDEDVIAKAVEPRKLAMRPPNPAQTSEDDEQTNDEAE
ncbi:MAG: hypothetical protein AAGD32_05335 [Planctomycetota bacterium]